MIVNINLRAENVVEITNGIKINVKMSMHVRIIFDKVEQYLRKYNKTRYLVLSHPDEKSSLKMLKYTLKTIFQLLILINI